MKKNQIRKIVEIAIFAALALIFDLLIPSLSPAFKISFKMVPIIILGLRWGIGAGLTGGFLWGLLQIIVGEAEILGVAQVLIEYLFAFAAVGLAGIMFKPMQKTMRTEKTSFALIGLFGTIAAVIGCFARYIFHFIAGIVFWGEYAPEGMSPVLNSLIVNGGAFLSELITCIVVLWLLVPTANVLFLNKSLTFEKK